MREYICDLCKKRITPSDIRMEVKVIIDDEKEEFADMHALCYYKLMRSLKDCIGEPDDERNKK